jgi:hypothetical protein
VPHNRHRQRYELFDIALNGGPVLILAAKILQKAQKAFELTRIERTKHRFGQFLRWHGAQQSLQVQIGPIGLMLEDLNLLL